MVRIAVVGGGFGGVFALLELERHLGNAHELLLFDPRPRFVFTPLLHEVAGGVLDARSVTVHYDKLLRHTHHIRQAVDIIDLERRYLVASGKRYDFDFVIIALGARTNFFGKEYDVLELKTYEDAAQVRATIEQNVRDAAKHDQTDSPLLRAVIVGGGPTGVEVAGECVDFMRFRIKEEGLKASAQVYLIQARERLLPQVDSYFHKEALRKLKQKGVTVLTSAKVIDIKEKKVMVEHSKKREDIAAACIVWTAGITPNTVRIPQVQEGPIPLERTLQIPGFAYAFAVGDCTRMTEPLPALAQVASRQGQHAAMNIAHILRGGEVKQFVFKPQGMLVSVGQKYAVGKIGAMPIKGFPAWFIMRTVYLFKFHNVRQELRTAYFYTLRLFVRDRKCLRTKR
jgi:NADH:ubiquinone reductase (H+-translocating)